MKRLWAAAALLASMIATAAYAAQQDFTITNHTGQAILTLNISPSEEAAWGPDLLGDNILADDAQAEISFDNEDERCEWDIRVTYENGGTGDWRGINLCETSDVELS